MTEDDQQVFKAKLEALEAEIQDRLSGADPTQASIAPDNAIGRLTRMEAIQAQHITAAGQRQLKTRLQQIRRALEQIEQGNYGPCVRCGDPIPRGRLEIMPETRLCVSCASKSR